MIFFSITTMVLAIFIIALSTIYSCEISPLSIALKKQMVDIGTWKPDCPVKIDRLRLIKFTNSIHEALYEKNQSKFMQNIQTSSFWEMSPEAAYEFLND